MIPGPFLLYLGHSDDAVGIKTSRGLAAFRPDDCVGEWRHDDCPLTLGLPRMDAAEGRAAGANTLILGIANAGGKMGDALVEDALAAIAVGMHVASGLHQRLRDEPRIAKAASDAGVQLFDVRDPPADLPVGNGRARAGNRLLTVGTDCSVGKMYTTLALHAAMVARGIDRVTVVPVFLGQGGHLLRDLPALCDGIRAAHPGLNLHVVGAIGEDPGVQRAMADYCVASLGD